MATNNSGKLTSIRDNCPQYEPINESPTNGDQLGMLYTCKNYKPRTESSLLGCLVCENLDQHEINTEERVKTERKKIMQSIRDEHKRQKTRDKRRAGTSTLDEDVELKRHKIRRLKL